MRREQQRAAGRLVTAARLDADEAILHQVDAANRIARANFVQHFDGRDRIEFDAVHRNRHAMLELDGYLLDRVRRFLRGLRPQSTWFGSGALLGSSSSPPSWLTCSRLRSRL